MTKDCLSSTPHDRRNVCPKHLYGGMCQSPVIWATQVNIDPTVNGKGFRLVSSKQHPETQTLCSTTGSVGSCPGTGSSRTVQDCISKRVPIWGYLDEWQLLQFIQSMWANASTPSEELSCSSRRFRVARWREKGHKLVSSPKWERLLVLWPLIQTLKLMEHSSLGHCHSRQLCCLHGPQPITISRFFFLVSGS